MQFHGLAPLVISSELHRSAPSHASIIADSQHITINEHAHIRIQNANRATLSTARGDRDRFTAAQLEGADCIHIESIISVGQIVLWAQHPIIGHQRHIAANRRRKAADKGWRHCGCIAGH